MFSAPLRVDRYPIHPIGNVAIGIACPKFIFAMIGIFFRGSFEENIFCKFSIEGLFFF
jgi:hypothetical protein